MIATTDIIFAVDSIPAIFAVTQEPFIVFAANAFALIGLRALYFLLVGLMDRFVYLTQGLAFILAFIGVKMLLDRRLARADLAVAGRDRRDAGRSPRCCRCEPIGRSSCGSVTCACSWRAGRAGGHVEAGGSPGSSPLTRP